MPGDISDKRLGAKNILAYGANLMIVFDIKEHGFFFRPFLDIE